LLMPVDYLLIALDTCINVLSMFIFSATLFEQCTTNQEISGQDSETLTLAENELLTSVKGEEL